MMFGSPWAINQSTARHECTYSTNTSLYDNTSAFDNVINVNNNNNMIACLMIAVNEKQQGTTMFSP